VPGTTIFWLPGPNDFRHSNTPVITIRYKKRGFKKRVKRKKKAPKKPQKHPIHKAIKWKEMLLGGSVGSLREVAQKEGITRARSQALYVASCHISS
jgi:hypothetical protein